MSVPFLFPVICDKENTGEIRQNITFSQRHVVSFCITFEYHIMHDNLSCRDIESRVRC